MAYRKRPENVCKYFGGFKALSNVNLTVHEVRWRACIDERYPQHGILGEEYGDRDLDADLVWVLDPTDGPAAVIECAGGIVTDWSGKAVDLDWRGQILTAGCEQMHEQVAAILAAGEEH